jgi:UPF0271 protein
MSSIDLNADLGEGVTDDAGLLQLVTSANVACGYHAGDPATMRAVCDRAALIGVAVGAQVSYADRAGFGRRAMEVGYETLREQVAEQVGVLDSVAQQSGTQVAYVKPHGALYNRVVDDEEHARAVLDGSAELPVLGLPGSAILTMAAGEGRTTLREGFPDRGYTEGSFSGRLVPRGEPGALVERSDEIAARAVEMARSDRIDSVCVHGDSPGAVQAARAVREALEAAGFEIRRAC